MDCALNAPPGPPSPEPSPGPSRRGRYCTRQGNR
jgi:hypothetical protein